MSFRDAIKCNICHDYAYHPVVLSCYHIFCAKCIEVSKMSSLRCPICDLSFYNCKLERNQFLHDLICKFLEEYGIYKDRSKESPPFSSSAATEELEQANELFRPGSCGNSASNTSFSTDTLSEEEKEEQNYEEVSKELVLHQSATCDMSYQYLCCQSEMDRKKLQPKETQGPIEFSVSSSDERYKKYSILSFALYKPQLSVADLQSHRTVERKDNSQVFKKITNLQEVSLSSDTSENNEEQLDIFGKPAMRCKVCGYFVKQQNFALHYSCCAKGKLSTMGRAYMQQRTPKKQKPKYEYKEDMSNSQIRDQLIVMGFYPRRLEDKSAYYLRNLCRLACKSYEELNNDAEFFKNQDAILYLACEQAVSNKNVHIELLLKLVENSDRYVYLTIRSILYRLRERQKTIDME